MTWAGSGQHGLQERGDSVAELVVPHALQADRDHSGLYSQEPRAPQPGHQGLELQVHAMIVDTCHGLGCQLHRRLLTASTGAVSW